MARALAAPVRAPVGEAKAAPPAGSVSRSITYTYDNLYRLTGASYNDGTSFTYTYDATGNRLTEVTTGGLSIAYVYDNANRLTSVDGVPYTLDAKGNLLSDGARTYAYDHANRLKTVIYSPTTYGFAYNGLGDRLRQTINGTPRNYSLDLEGGLTQVLADGTNTYLYGLSRVGELQPGGWQYHLGDALGSVRQLTGPTAGVTLARSYQPFGTPLTSAGTASSVYQFTGEQRDGTGLTYLRARYYASSTGRFITTDPSGLESNLYTYSGANPTSRVDRSGLLSLEGLAGPAAFAMCFDIHTRLMGNALVTARMAVDICKLAYSQDAWDRNWFAFSGTRPASGNDLFGWYLFEQGTESRLEFDATDTLTVELAKSFSIHTRRINAYMFGDTGKNIPEYRFNLMQQAACFLDLQLGRGASFPLTCVMGSYYYQIKTVPGAAGDWLGFRIDNRTDLESGTHIPFRFPGEQFGGSVEELILNGTINGNELLPAVVNHSYGGEKVVSILRARTRERTGAWSPWWGGTNQLGGGNLVQTFSWLERRDPCPFPSILIYAQYVKDLEILPWPDVAHYTYPIPQWGEVW